MVIHKMNNLSKLLNSFLWYRELKHIYKGYRQYRTGNRYVYYRFWVNARLHKQQLPLDLPVNTQTYSVHLMCGRLDLDQLFWCLASWYRVVAEYPQVYIHDDSTLTRQQYAQINRLLPQAKIIDYQSATEQARNKWLTDFPLLQAARNNSRDTRPVQLIDPYFIGQSDYVMIMDTDILWFQPPIELLEYMREYRMPVFWQNASPCPFFFENGESLREDLLHHNGGLIFYQKRDFDLSLLEEFLQRRGRTQERFRNQPAYAYVLGQHRPVAALPKDRYKMKGAVTGETVGRHYTAPRRAKFWFEGVRHVQRRFSLC